MLGITWQVPCIIANMQKNRKSIPEALARELQGEEQCSLAEAPDWLKPLIKAYEIINKGVSEGLSLRKKHGSVPACQKGCSHCCETQPIPLTSFEVAGLAWYLIEHTHGLKRLRLAENLMNVDPSKGCPMVLDNACAVYPMRPIACRQYVIFGKSCGIHEEPLDTRPNEVFHPSIQVAHEAFGHLLPYYNIAGREARDKALKEHFIQNKALLIQGIDWSPAIKKMLPSYDGTSDKSQHPHRHRQKPKARSNRLPS